jgi:hypothetical protein
MNGIEFLSFCSNTRTQLVYLLGSHYLTGQQWALPGGQHEMTFTSLGSTVLGATIFQAATL